MQILILDWFLCLKKCQKQTKRVDKTEIQLVDLSISVIPKLNEADNHTVVV